MEGDAGSLGITTVLTGAMASIALVHHLAPPTCHKTKKDRAPVKSYVFKCVSFNKVQRISLLNYHCIIWHEIVRNLCAFLNSMINLFSLLEKGGILI